jgi:hypothetical protein
MGRRGLLLSAVGIGCFTLAASARGKDAHSSAIEFLANLYSGYRAGEPTPDPLGERASEIFAPSLLFLIRFDQAKAEGEVGFLDHDPICACQDYDGFHLTNIKVGPSNDSFTSATVSFLIGTQAQDVFYYLIDVSGNWRVADLSNSRIGSLQSFLETRLLRFPTPRSPHIRP